VALADYCEADFVVVVFLGTKCPIANAYIPELNDLQKRYRDRKVQVLGVNSNPSDSPQDIARHVKEFKIDFPVLIDGRQVVLDLTGARRTPEALLLDRRRAIRYRGRIDDRVGYDFQREKARRSDLEEALKQLLDGKEVAVAQTDVEGCLVTRRASLKAGDITYARHVAPILQERCAGCHHPGTAAPFSLLTYDDARDWSEMIREVVVQRRMPPWRADPRYGKFRNDLHLSPDQIDTLVAWIDRGTPFGDKKDLPQPRQFADGWINGKPDIVLKMPREYTVQATGTVEYQYFVTPTNFTEDVWVQASEARPGNRKVVHHIIAFIREKGMTGRTRLPHAAGFAPGEEPLSLPAGVGMRIPAGAEIVWQVHYTPTGKVETDRSELGLILCKERPERAYKVNGAFNTGFSIPPGAGNHRVVSKVTFANDVELLTLMPHMHLRGKDFRYTATYPDGRKEILLNVPNYDFNWQHLYLFAKPLPLPKGTTVECVAHFDNSAANPANPDPSKTVRWGDQTWEEMMIGWYSYMEAARPLRPGPDTAVREAWKKAGAEPGWIDATIGFGNQMFYGAGQRRKDDLAAFRLADSPLTTLKGLPSPDFPFGLSLRGAKVTDADLKALVPLKHLHTLHLADTTITDAGLKEFALMPQLRTLSLSGAAVTDAGLKELARLMQLQALNLSATQVADAGLKDLAGMKQLQALNLLHTKVTETGLKELAGLKLKVLWVPFGCQTDKGLEAYLAAVHPVSLNLNGWRRVTDAGFKNIARLKQVKALYLSDTAITDAGLCALAESKELETLDLSDTAITDAGVKSLAGLDQLQTLSLQYTKTADDGLKALAQLKQLRELNLQNTKTTDAGVASLADLPQLRSLNLRYTGVTDAGLKQVGRLKQLRELNLHGAKVSDAGLRELAGLAQLQSLNLYFTQVSDSGLKALAGMKQLQSLDLSDTKVTDAGLKELAGLQQLRSLKLRHAAITDAGLKDLGGMKQLRALDIHQTRATNAGVAQLQRALPECDISR
jgi:Leucine-rich repeat (LRR) protein